MAGYNDDFTSPYSDHVNKYNGGVFSSYKFTITKFVAAPTRRYGYRDMVVRGFTSNVTHETKEKLAADFFCFFDLYDDNRSGFGQ